MCFVAALFDYLKSYMFFTGRFYIKMFIPFFYLHMVTSFNLPSEKLYECVYYDVTLARRNFKSVIYVIKC